MSDFYSELSGVATEVLTEFKQGVVTLTRAGTSTPGANSWDPPTESDPVTYTLSAVAKGVSKEFIDGTAIVATDLQVTCAVPPVAPLMTDAIEVDGRGVTILRIDAIPPAGTPVAYRLFLRG